MKKIKVMWLIGMVAILVMGCGSKESTNQTAVETTVETTKGSEETKEEVIEESTTEAQETKEETTAVETTGEATKESGSKPQNNELSDDIYSFQISIDGDVYQFPMKYNDFVAYGWQYDGDESATLDSMYKAGTQVFNKKKLQCYATIVNFDINALPLNACYVTGIQIETSQNKSGAEIIMPNGIQLGVAVREDIKAAYGEPTVENNLDSGTSYYRYNRDIYQGVEFSFFQDKKELNKVDINNIAKPDDLEIGEATTEVPDIVNLYKEPKEMTDDFSRFTITYDDKLYRLPAPVSEFEKNGWKVQEDKSEVTVAGRDFGWVTMMKDNQTLKVIADNYSSEATSIHNCFIGSVVSDDSGVRIPLVISGGITIGMDQDKLLDVISDQDYELTDDSDLYACYELTPGSSSMDVYDIYVHKSDQKVYKIEVENSPKFSQFEKWLNQ